MLDLLFVGEERDFEFYHLNQPDPAPDPTPHLPRRSHSTTRSGPTNPTTMSGYLHQHDPAAAIAPPVMSEQIVVQLVLATEQTWNIFAWTLELIIRAVLGTVT